jgi:hypothetical protein
MLHQYFRSSTEGESSRLARWLSPAQLKHKTAFVIDCFGLNSFHETRD